ncbi:hypothetical protein BDZ94DRAFT_533745 [Collybia nuda]|uniref:F-box domain-containing protein n=1 Tax=Collybia nuda TaxID=64659 RepID=A0A9P6CKR8_9AGAR|nr:hypothetical protein BDZ94DRAFT_533745 [Collybia nuda]
MQPTTPKRCKASSAEDLPNELLTIIFKLVHQLEVFHKESINLRLTEDPYDKYWFSCENLTSAARFPNSLAHVCSAWRTIMSSVPSFWTDIVVIVNTSSPVPFSLPDIQSVLEWTRDLPLNISVTRRIDSPPLDSFNERKILVPLINIFSPQIHRCQSFAFYATHSSALPLIGRDINGSAPLLRELKLECEVDDGTMDIIPDWSSFSCPSLFNLVINGSNFINITRHDPNWLTNLQDLRWVTFNRLKLPTQKDVSRSHVSFLKFIEMLANEDLELEYLRIFDFNPGHYNLDSSEELTIIILEISKRLVLEDLSDPFVHQFSRTISLYADELHISKCSLTAMEDIPFTENLKLEDISPAEDLSISLRKWPGSVLTLSRCLGFNDRVLDMMGDPDVLHDFFDNSPNNLVKLILIDCPNFSIEALKRMLEGRNEDVEDVLRYYGPPAIEGIKVNGAGPSLSYEDVEWFKGRLRYLDWHTEQRDGAVSLVEFDAEEQVTLDLD